MATIVSSFQEASRIMEDRGISIDAKTICELSRRYAQRAEYAKNNDDLGLEPLSGRRVIISTDGGRVRIREIQQRGPKTQKGRHRYTTKWREPKLLIIYTVDEQGKKSSAFSPVIEGTMKGPDELFGLIKFYLRQLKIDKADKILFVADGARWIWNRVPDLVVSLGISVNRLNTLIDFYHAVEHLVKMADLRSGWKKKERQDWVKKHRRLLLNGKINEVITSIRTICRGRKSKKLMAEKNYFVRNKKHMRYDKISKMGLPIGSGAMESAIRRVVNLRLKGASIYWLKETAEAMLMLRSFYKAGRWNMLNKLSFSTTCIELM